MLWPYSQNIITLISYCYDFNLVIFLCLQRLKNVIHRYRYFNWNRKLTFFLRANNINMLYFYVLPYLSPLTTPYEMHVCFLWTPCGDSFGSLIAGSVEEQSGETDSGCSQPMHIHPYICSLPNTHTHTHTLPLHPCMLFALRSQASTVFKTKEEKWEREVKRITPAAQRLFLYPCKSRYALYGHQCGGIMRPLMLVYSIALGHH